MRTLKQNITYVGFNGVFAVVVYNAAFEGNQAALSLYAVVACTMGVTSLVIFTKQLLIPVMSEEHLSKLLKAQDVSIGNSPWWWRYLDACYDLAIIVVMAPIAPITTGLYFVALVASQGEYVQYHKLRGNQCKGE